jgi:hypothetical protein
MIAGHVNFISVFIIVDITTRRYSFDAIFITVKYNGTRVFNLIETLLLCVLMTTCLPL